MAMELKESRKRFTSYKFRIGDIAKGKPAMIDGRLAHVEIGDKNVARVNLIANVIDRYIADGEKKYAVATVDDASGQIKLKTFGDDIELIKSIQQGDTLQIVGLIRDYNGELYVLPEILKQVEPKWLLVRKLEMQTSRKDLLPQSDLPLRDMILQRIKDSEKEEGIDTEKLIMEMDSSPNIISAEIKKLMEDGMIYESRPGRLRYIG